MAVFTSSLSLAHAEREKSRSRKRLTRVRAYNIESRAAARFNIDRDSPGPFSRRSVDARVFAGHEYSAESVIRVVLRDEFYIRAVARNRVRFVARNRVDSDYITRAMCVLIGSASFRRGRLNMEIACVERAGITRGRVFIA